MAGNVAIHLPQDPSFTVFHFHGYNEGVAGWQVQVLHRVKGEGFFGFAARREFLPTVVTAPAVDFPVYTFEVVGQIPVFFHSTPRGGGSCLRVR